MFSRVQYRQTERQRQRQIERKKKKRDSAKRSTEATRRSVWYASAFGNVWWPALIPPPLQTLRSPPRPAAPYASRGCRPIEGGDYYWVRAHRTPPPAAPVAAPLLRGGGGVGGRGRCRGW